MQAQKIALGTAQFGSVYGINNRRGQVPPDEVRRILEIAKQAGVSILDTAPAYGASEQVLGEIETSNSFQIVSKLPAGEKDVMGACRKSLSVLRRERLYGFILHHFEDFTKDPSIWNQMCDVRNAGLADKIGFSLYHPRELDHIYESGIKPDLIQIPYNILDQRFEDWISRIGASVEIHVRSIFLQGLLFKQHEDLKGAFVALKEQFELLESLEERFRMSRSAILMHFASANPGISRIVIGVDGLADFDENLVAYTSARPEDKMPAMLNELRRCAQTDESLILPSLWPRET